MYGGMKTCSEFTAGCTDMNEPVNRFLLHQRPFVFRVYPERALVLGRSEVSTVNQSDIRALSREGTEVA